MTTETEKKLISRFRAIRRAGEAQGKRVFMGLSGDDSWLTCHFMVDENNPESPKVRFLMHADTQFKTCYVALVWPDGRTFSRKCDELKHASAVQVVAAGLDLAATIQ
jgi:hypothetical protein